MYRWICFYGSSLLLQSSINDEKSLQPCLVFLVALNSSDDIGDVGVDLSFAIHVFTDFIAGIKYGAVVSTAKKLSDFWKR